MKKQHFALLFSLAFFFSTASFASKIGYVNVNAVLSNSSELKAESDKIRQIFKPREAKIIALSDKLQTRVKSFKKNKDTMLESEAKKEIASLVKLESELQSKTNKLKEDISKKNELVLESMQSKINNAINKIAKAQNFDIVLYQEIAYVNDASNISEQVSKLLEK